MRIYDSFSIIHAISYTLIGYQTAYLATKWNPLYWNTACLLTNSGSLDNETNESTDYAKVAKALGETLAQNIKISLVDINKSDFGFRPDAETNSIIYGMKGIQNVGKNVIDEIIAKRPFKSFEDYCNRTNIDRRANIMLIKAGAFDSFMDRKKIMVKYIWDTCGKKRKLTLQNMPTLLNKITFPTELEFELKIYEFNKYLKANCKSGEYFELDAPSYSFYTKYFDYSLLENEKLISQKKWDKIYQSAMDPVRDWLSKNEKEILRELNEEVFLEDWIKYGLGSLSAWEMEALCFYYHDHELKNIDYNKYGLSCFNKLSEEPVIERTFTKGDKVIPLYRIDKICGTCIAKNKDKSTVTLLTPENSVVTVKFNKEYFTMFDRQISEKRPDGTKKVVEKSWFNKGSMILIQGIRRGDDFIAKRYKSTGGHTVYKINKIDKNGEIEIISDRVETI